MMRSTFFDRQATAPVATFKLAILGHSGVGKSSLINRFCNETFSNTYTPTIGYPVLSNVISVEQQQVKLQLWEINPEKCNQYGNVQQHVISNTDALVVLFELSSETSFQAAKELVTMLQQSQNISKDAGKIFLVGTKSDLINNRKISDETAQSYANQAGCRYFAVSAKHNSNVDVLFNTIGSTLFTRLPAVEANDWFMIDDESSHTAKLSTILSDQLWVKSEGFMSKVKAGLKEIISALNADAQINEAEHFNKIQSIAKVYSRDDDKSAFHFFSNENSNSPLKNALRAITSATSFADAAAKLQEMKNRLSHESTHVINTQTAVTI